MFRNLFGGLSRAGIQIVEHQDSGDSKYGGGSTRDECLPMRLGRVFVTPAAQRELGRAQVTVSSLLDRHATGNWGFVTTEEWASNDDNLISYETVTSVYALPGTGAQVLVNTDGSRTSTVVFLPQQG